ncbi:DUF1501 domain-containing protein [Paraliomyxa miuraensis]|uniref:DUF1501 domain-containing protein n=1 Tax=Paraliomyxa miuraensis TaxID=376150 RepID=UPI002250EFA7|nr:DUF1501 domain-containing protein [Paraliomyxa miuraensis]MCX4246962.1 DUF1501 domain-containing protein [Paraliomyxa miuraensis]
MRRRTFLKTAAGTSAAAGAGIFGILKYPRGANAAGWGTWPSDREDLMLPEDLRPQSVLELCFHGGITAWETFYAVESWGTANNTFINLFDDEPDNSPRNFYENICQYGPGSSFVTDFAEDAAGLTVGLGPWLYPLKERPDILSRMRVLVQSHTVLAHEGANPVSFTGDFVGNPRMAGLGAPIQRYFNEQPGGSRAVPYSFILYPGGAGFSGFNVGSASAIGFHPGAARPLNVTVSQDSVLAELLARPGLEQSDPEAFDAAVSYYTQAYENRFRSGGVGKASRSLERNNYAFANFARQNANELIEVLSPDLFAEIQGQICPGPGVPAQSLDMPAMMANVARSLLTRTTNRARYVNWIDTGIYPRPEIGYDVHNEHVPFTARSVPHTLQQLANIIRDPGNPGPQDDQLLDLDQTMIVINMEFGRTPHRQVAGSSGTNHWPYGYVNVVIGGPIRAGDSRSPGASIYGNITEESGGYAQTYVSPTENRVMMLAALGIYPFSSQSYAVADVRQAADEIEAIARVRDELWGISV